MKIRFVLILVTLALLTVSGYPQGTEKIPISIIHKGEDVIGSLLAFEVKRLFTDLPDFHHSAFNKQGLQVVLKTATFDSEAELLPEPISIFAYVLLIKHPDHLPFYLDTGLGGCTRNSYELFAKMLVASLESLIANDETIQKLKQKGYIQ